MNLYKITRISGTRRLILTGLLAAGIVSPLRADNWPCWRGPRGTGVSLEVEAPLNWSSSENIAWRTEIPGRGRSSPIVFGDRVFLTTGVDEDESRRVMCIDRSDGKILWATPVHKGPGGKMHHDNTMASSTPATDGERVFAVFVDDQGMKVVAVDFDGRIVWSSSPGTFYSSERTRIRKGSSYRESGWLDLQLTNRSGRSNLHV